MKQRIVLPKLCDRCERLFNGLLNHAQRDQAMVEGFLFHWCPENKIHISWTESGQATLQPCVSSEIGRLINGSYVSALRYHNRHLAQLLASEIANSTTPISSDAKPHDDNDDDRLAIRRA